MKQLVASNKTGEVALLEVPMPALRAGGVLVRNRASLVSAGTERATLELAGRSLVGKARARPDLVRKFLDRMSRDGIAAATKAALAKLDEPIPLGYSCAGEVVAVGAGAEEFAVGDRVACGGIGYASHAEYVFVPKNLCAKIPAGVSFDNAAFVSVASIAMHGFRLSGAGVGESVAVIGAGLIGQLALQVAAAAGCRTIAIDTNPQRCELARRLGAELALTSGHDNVAREVLSAAGGGMDAVLICAATKSSEPLALAAQICRDKARVVAVGDVGLDVSRRDFYQKELELVVCRSYGPGRYDREYEENGHDYPLSHVRWTEKRNFSSFLQLAACGKVEPGELITHRFKVDQALEAFDLVMKGKEPSLGVVLLYPGETDEPARISFSPAVRKGAEAKTVGVSVIGAGSFARAVLIPELSRLKNVRLRGIVTSSGVTAEHSGRKFGFDYCASNISEILEDEETDAVVIATRHSTHAALASSVLSAGKAVLVEKPLTTDRDGLAEIEQALKQTGGFLMVGYNRRFSAAAAEMKREIGTARPVVFHYTVNAGEVPPGHWLLDPAEGGRVVGEVGHFIDLMAFLCDSLPVSVAATGDGTNEVEAVLRFADSSTASLLYTGQGDSGYTKERLEAFAAGEVHVLEDFRRLVTMRNGKRRTRKFTQDKGHRAELAAFVKAVQKGDAPPVSFETVRAVTLATLAVRESAATGQFVNIERK